MDSWSGPGESGEIDSRPLPELLVSWRRRVDRSDLPEAADAFARERPGAGLSRSAVARLTGVTEDWYGSLERGEGTDCSEDFLDRLSTALRLNHTERTTLYLRTTGQPPTSAAIPQAEAAVEMDELLQRFIDNQSHPACVADVAWNVIGHNQQMRDWFPWAAHHGNIMRWALLSPEAREQLVNWREDWARAYVGQIRYARSHYRKNEALRRLKRDLLSRSSDVRDMWHRREVREHGDGSIRKLRLPYHQGREIVVHIVALRPMRSDRLRVFVLMEDPPSVVGG
ncbi:helix-turn-helix transcriptional regulator [Streptomyces sp. IBSBF 2435]|uniref:helix-turn-helix transcriptional regulator n=1 Tax=Streptomyces sp. IBSBF 2435 TaxID=2903531 RepID=UPI002FDC5B06